MLIALAVINIVLVALVVAVLTLDTTTFFLLREKINKLMSGK